MSEAGLGKLCIFDTEKARLLRGVGTTFDALEIEQTDECRIYRMGDQRRRARQNYGCFALDSWAAYFGAKHSEMIEAVREKTGDPLAQPSPRNWRRPDDLAVVCANSASRAENASYRRPDSANRQEAKEDNELGACSDDGLGSRNSST
jgi:hypothetical protein